MIKMDNVLIDELEGKQSMPFNFVLKRLTEERNGLLINDNLDGLQNIWDDYLPNELAWPFMSERLKSLVESCLSGKEGLDWIEVIVIYKTERRKYFIPRFSKKLDTLDPLNTRYVHGTDQILVPCFSSKKIESYHIFHGESIGNLWKISPLLYVSERIKGAIKKEKLIGLSFEKVKVI